MNPQKLLNYVLQNLETANNVLILWDIFKILRGKNTKLVLYVYDSFLFDFDNTVYDYEFANKEALEKSNYTVDENTVYSPQGQPVAGVDAYGQVWYKDSLVEELCTQEVELVRARNSKGHYIADDPNTPENEAWTTKKKKKKWLLV